MTLSDFGGVSIVFAVICFGLFMLLAFLEENHKKLKDHKFSRLASEVLAIGMIGFGVIAALLLFISYASQPTPLEKCLDQIKGVTDQKSIDYMQDYCYTTYQE